MGLGFSVLLRIGLSRSMMVEEGQRSTEGNLTTSMIGHLIPFYTESMTEVITVDMIGIKPKLFMEVVHFPTTGGPLSDQSKIGGSTFRQKHVGSILAAKLTWRPFGV